MIELVIGIIIVALIFDLLNGMNDAANSIATVVSTRVLSPLQAVSWAAFFNMFALLIFGVKVAETIGTGIVNANVINEYTILAALIGAIIWAALATMYGMPISISHALIGGLVGAGVATAGFSVVITSGLYKILLFMVVSPVLGVILGFLFMALISRKVAKVSPVKLTKVFGRLQLISAAAYSIGHGGNDAQKTIGIITVLLFTTGYLGTTFYIPLWVILLSYSVIALGTLLGGWKVIKTMGVRITRLTTVHGFSAETVGSVVLFTMTFLGIPVSSTHVIAGSIIGVGSTRGRTSVRWGVTRNIVSSWILTIPITGTIAMVSYSFLVLLGVV
ncbi:MAG: inorganic phosphate transporter [Thaumarchaeota archaeon]|nr:inorganic phosphate transporter [Nitrososphaerota archaeon]